MGAFWGRSRPNQSDPASAAQVGNLCKGAGSLWRSVWGGIQDPIHFTSSLWVPAG